MILGIVLLAIFSVALFGFAWRRRRNGSMSPDGAGQGRTLPPVVAGGIGAGFGVAFGLIEYFARLPWPTHDRSILAAVLVGLVVGAVFTAANLTRGVTVRW